MNQKSLLQKTIQNKIPIIILWFLIPALLSLSTLRLIYYLHWHNFINVSFQVRFHINQINYVFPILQYSIGLILSSLIFSKIYLKLKRSFISCSIGAILGVLIYIFAVSLYFVIHTMFKPNAGLRDLLYLPFATLVSFTGVCFLDCSHGYAWPSLPFGLIWRGLLPLILNRKP